MENYLLHLLNCNLTHSHHGPLKGPFEGISRVQPTTGPHHQARSVVGAVNDIRILHGVYRKFTVQDDW